MAKTITFAILHFSVAFAVGYLLTGDVMVGGAIALVEPAVNTVGFHFHERLWRRFERRRPESGPAHAGYTGASPT
ncbi:MAG: DUF2061 domain-containing protein [Gammaproteobacteria bacterium]